MKEVALICPNCSNKSQPEDFFSPPRNIPNYELKTMDRITMDAQRCFRSTRTMRWLGRAIFDGEKLNPPRKTRRRTQWNRAQARHMIDFLCSRSVIFHSHVGLRVRHCYARYFFFYTRSCNNSYRAPIPIALSRFWAYRYYFSVYFGGISENRGVGRKISNILVVHFLVSVAGCVESNRGCCE